MNKRQKTENLIVVALILSSLLLNYVTITYTGASSTPKNLVNLYGGNPLNDSSSSSNPASINQFQNEYQYRQSATKPTTPDRSKTTTPSFQDSEHVPPTDQASGASTDYLYPEGKGTTNVPDCKGRLRLNDTRGTITDGFSYYEINLQCSWLIDSGRDNATIRIRFHQFNTECNYDYVYIFNGDSIFSPLIAALSGDMKDFGTILTWARHGDQINSLTDFNKNSTALKRQSILTNGLESQPLEIEVKSSKAFIYFHSDTAQRMPGFYMTYSIDACPLDCSNRGECDLSSLICHCNQGSYGNGCQFSVCPNNCTTPENGHCDENLSSCVCKKGFYGEDCSKDENEPHWLDLNDLNVDVPSRAFHQSVVVDGLMWIIGGRSDIASNSNTNIFRRMKTTVAFSYDLVNKQWSNVSLDGFTGSDHLAEVSGHSVAAKGSKIFIYGGLAMNNTVLDTLSVLDTKDNTIVQISSGKRPRSSLVDDDFTAPIAVAGHTANIIDSDMFIFFGYNPLYGYINEVQKFNLADNSWSIVERKGSYVDGCIGHSSTFDPVSSLVFLYGGHHSQRSNTLYSFDPHTEVWTFLQSGPSQRYYHSSLIINQQLIIIGGNTFNFTHQSDQCFQTSYLVYDTTCAKSKSETVLEKSNLTVGSNHNCGRECWRSFDDSEPGFLKRYGHSVVNHNNSELVMFGGFNGVILNDFRYMKISTCDNFLNETSCDKQQLGLSCRWNAIENKCQEILSSTSNSSSATIGFEPLTNRASNCTKNAMKALQNLCESRETCSDCLHTNLGCVWCGFLSQCQYSKCKSSSSKTILDADLCYKDEYSKDSMVDMSFGPHPLRALPATQDFDTEVECKRLNNCYLCQSKHSCSWQNDDCVPNAPSALPSPSSNHAPQEDFTDMYGAGSPIIAAPGNSSRALQRYDPINRSFLSAFTSSLLNSAPYHTCDVPCYKRRSCNDCTRTKCIWCSTTEQCIDSSAYFAYYAMGQCMHYVAHSQKCSIASCSDIETCDKCLTNPKCGWLNDIDNRGKGRCMEGTQNGPFGLSGGPSAIGNGNYSLGTQVDHNLASGFPNWHYNTCPLCQCNGHASCKSNTSVCIQPCQDNTEGPHCNRCMPGYYGDPTNGGTCRLCRCNGHATYCNRETGRCYCSTKGVTGHNCNRCDDQNHYIGDPLSPSNGTCYYNLTTDYQYTFNMSKPEDHYYSDINFINVPLRRDSDVEFSIACSRLALVNITSGSSYKSRKPIHTIIECGSQTLRFPHDRYSLTESNYSFFVHVYKFQTPFILQIAFSQHRTLKLPQFFLTFSR